MTQDAASPSPPLWVRKRDGRLVPFEPDEISRSLFAATERLGRPDAFLARELTDSVVHFLAAEVGDDIPTTAVVADIVAKVVRELGQPALAQAYAAECCRSGPLPERPKPPLPPADDPVAGAWQLARQELGSRLRLWALSPDLRAAEADGLLRFPDLHAPYEIAAAVLTPPISSDADLVSAIEAARRITGHRLIVDSPEYALDPTLPPSRAAARFVRQLEVGLRLTGLAAVVNLNVATPPPWADHWIAGPLFAGHHRPLPPEHLAQLRHALLEQLLADSARRPVAIHWHLDANDIDAAAGPLTRLVRRACDGAPLTFVFDRGRQPVSLAEGVDRHRGALLMTVGLDLLHLMEQPGGTDNLERFLTKLASLTRLAVSAGVQRRDFLRRCASEHVGPARGFVLERARLLVVPMGLAVAARQFTPRTAAADPSTVAHQIWHRLQEVLMSDGRSRRLDTCMDLAEDIVGSRPQDATSCGPGPQRTEPMERQLRHVEFAAPEPITLLLPLPETGPRTVEACVAALHRARQQVSIARLRFFRSGARGDWT
ncbi:MAG: ATP cone domain-containing protein [Gemmataceae bacterium]|nr:ATP cone domain-containing protein [Gemmataceae bacterium]MDW8266268.1 ATP cone domain-containing protein [Gemmataceae bacterium]